MSLYGRSARERCDEAEAEQERDFPACDACEGRIGLDCKGHCLDCGDEPEAHEDFCAACTAKINAIGMCGRCGDPKHNGQCEGFGDA